MYINIIGNLNLVNKVMWFRYDFPLKPLDYNEKLQYKLSTRFDERLIRFFTNTRWCIIDTFNGKYFQCIHISDNVCNYNNYIFMGHAIYFIIFIIMLIPKTYLHNNTPVYSALI